MEINFMLRIRSKNLFTMFLIGLMIMLFSNTAFAEKRWDLLTIESIKCVKPAGGVDEEIEEGFGGVVGVLATIGVAVVMLGDEEDPKMPSKSSLEKVAAEGNKKAKEALDYIDRQFSGQDDLIVQVNGQLVLPKIGGFKAIEAGKTINPNIQVSFRDKVRISLIEYDSGSDHDDLGNVIIDSSSMKSGETQRSEDLFVYAPSAEDGSIYLVTARVDAGKGDPGSVPQWVKCGTAQCVACKKAKCSDRDHNDLDRDGDKGDLKRCPPNYKHADYQKYPQIWPAEDVYLRTCMLDDVRLLGVGMSNGLFVRDSLTAGWQPIPNSGNVIDIATMPNGKIVGVGMSNGLFVRDSLTSGWRPIPDSGKIIAITVMPDGKIVGVGMSNGLFVRDGLTTEWRAVPNSGKVIDVAAMPDGKLVGVGMSNGLLVRDSLTAGWRPIPNSGNVISITTTLDGKIVGVGMSNGLFVRDSLIAGWRPIPDSGKVIAIANR